MMKRIGRFILTVAAAAITVSCVEDIAEDPTTDKTPSGELVEMTFTASYTDTKTTLVNGVEVWWKPGDNIAVNGDSFYTRIEEKSPRTEFTGSTAIADAYYAVYPYLAVKSWENNQVKVFLPQSYYTGHAINEGWNISAAMCSEIDGELMFRNLIGYVKMTITDNSWKIKKISVQSNDSEVLCGECVIKWENGNPVLTPVADGLVFNNVYTTTESEDGFASGDIYIGMVPGTYSSGLTFTFESVDGKVDRKVIRSSITLESGVIQNIGKIEGLSDMIAKQRAALVDIYESAGGDDWDNNTNWCSDAPVREWYGVEVDDAGLVTALDLLNNGLICEDIPESFKDLTSLERLWIRTTSTDFPYNVLNQKGLTFLQWDIDEYSGPLPKEISQLSNLTHLGISGLLTSIPEELGDMIHLEYLQIMGPWFGAGSLPGGIPSCVRRLENLKYFGMSYFNLGVEIPDWIYEMTWLESLYLNNLNLTGELSEKIADLRLLKSLSFSENALEGDLPNGLASLTGLETLYLQLNNFTGNIPYGFSNMTDLIEIWIYGNRLSGILPEDFEQNPNFGLWGVEQNVFSQQEGYILSLPSQVYVSTDYSKDGTYLTLKDATIGNGVDIVLLGDGFADKDMEEGGAFDQAMQEALGYLFSLEPMASYQDYFNVYAVRAVSKNDRFGSGYETAFEGEFGTPPDVSGNIDKCVDYARKAPIKSTDDLVIAVIMNSNTYAGVSFWCENDLAVAFVGMNRPVDGFYEKTFESILIHEVVGHCFGKLADEYVYKNETYPGSGDMALREEWMSLGYNANVDVISDPDRIRWAHMLNDDRYSSYTGIIEGGDYYAYGIWRPEEDSMMSNNVPYFNAPSREAIVKRIMKLAGEEFTFEKFASKDEYSPLPYTRANYVERTFEPTHPPVIVKGSWRDAVK